MHYLSNQLTRALFLVAVVLVLTFSFASADDITMGLLEYDNRSLEGYTLIAPPPSNTIYLIDIYGRVVHTWESSHTTGLAAYLNESGQLVRAVSFLSAGDQGGGVEIQSWDGNTVWSYSYEDQHHDIEQLPNGNILILAHDDMDSLEAIAQGRDPQFMSEDKVTLEKIIEIKPIGLDSGEVVWEWYVRDHLIQDFDSGKANYGSVENHPELIDFNTREGREVDWLHANHIAYNAEYDQIVISFRTISEIWVIDHSTTTAQASGHTGGLGGKGGDILYRWGNPQVYRAGDDDDQEFYDQHAAHWIADGLDGAGDILVFSNGKTRPDGNYSTVEMITPPVDVDGSYTEPVAGEAFEPGQQTWVYVADPPESMYSPRTSSAQRLSNGNTLICAGINGILTEITPQEEIVWKFINPVHRTGPMHQGDSLPPQGNGIFKVYRYTPDYPAFAGRDLSPGGRLELYSIDISGVTHVPETPDPVDSVIITAKVESDSAITAVTLMVNPGSGFAPVTMYDDGLHGDELSGDNIYGIKLAPFPGFTEVSYYVSAEISGGENVRDPAPSPDISYGFTVNSPGYICGDANDDMLINVSDAVIVINYAFGGGPAPDPLMSADINCDTAVDVSDAVYVINYAFSGGASPCDPDDDGAPDC